MVQENDLSNLVKLINKIDARLTRIESELSVRQYEPEEESKFEEISEIDSTREEKDEEVEFRFGQKWFAKFGIVAFLLAILNLIVLPLPQISSSLIIIIGSMIGLILVASPFVVRNKIKEFSGYLFGSGIIILYFTILKLHYFTEAPMIENLNTLLINQYFISLVALIYAILKKSQFLTALCFLLLNLTSLFANTVYAVHLSILVITFLAVTFSKKYNWDGLLNFSFVINIFTQLLWYLNNPLLGNQINIEAGKSYSVIITLITIAVYGFGRVKSFTNEIEEGTAITRSIIVSVFGYLLSFYMVFRLNSNLFFATNILIALLFILIASYHYVKIQSKIVTFIYSMVGYASLSIGIVSYFGIPTNFVLLCWQSVLVVSTALWFRSKFIVVANFFIFLSILIANFIIGNGLNASSLNFGIVALVSARIINWQKNRLGLETQNLRNAYLILATIINPVIIYQILPGQYVGIAWIGLAFLYYVLGKILANKKYRLMSTFTLVVSLIYSVIYGLTAGEAIYKVISFVVVSIALIIMSVIYSKTKR